MIFFKHWDLKFHTFLIIFSMTFESNEMGVIVIIHTEHNSYHKNKNSYLNLGCHNSHHYLQYFYLEPNPEYWYLFVLSSEIDFWNIFWGGFYLTSLKIKDHADLINWWQFHNLEKLDLYCLAINPGEEIQKSFIRFLPWISYNGYSL